MKTLFRFIISSLVMLVCLNISIAQDEDTPIPYPPITPDNASQLQMIQVLSKGEPRAFSWSPDGTQLAITAEGGTWIYDVTQEDMPSYWVKEHDSSPRIVYAPNHDIYISYESVWDCEYLDCPHGQKVFIRDGTTHDILYEIDRAFSPFAQFSPDGNLLAIATYDGRIRLWHTESFLTQTDENPDDFMICEFSTIASPLLVTFSADSSLITYRGYSPFNASPTDYSLWFWDTHTCELKIEIPVLVTNQIMTVPFNAEFIAYSRNGHYLITRLADDVSDNSGVYLWDMVAFENLGKLSDLFSGSFLSFGFEGNTILFREDGIIRERDIESKNIIKEYDSTNILYLNDGTTLIKHGKRYYRLTEKGEQAFIPHDIPVDEFLLSSNQEWLLTYHRDSNGFNEIALLWNLPEEKLIKSFKSQNPARYSSLHGFSPDSKLFFWSDKFYPYSIILLDLETLEERYVGEYRGVGNQLYWSESESILVSYGSNQSDFYNTRFIDVWKYNGAGFQRLWGQPSENAILKAWSDNFVIVKTRSGYLEFYNLQTGELVTSIHQNECNSSESQSYCNILANAQLVNPRDEDIYQNPIARLSDDHQSLEVIDSLTNEVIITYPVPMPINDSSSMWRFDDSGDLLLATKSKLYNLTQNTLLVEMPRIGTGEYTCDDYECPYQSSETWLSDNLDFLISIETYNESPRYTRSLLRVWDIQANQEIYNLLFYKDGGADLALFEGLLFQFTSDMRWLFEFRFDVPNYSIQTIYYRDLNIFNGLTGEHVVTLPTFNENAYDAQFSPDNRFLITSSDTLRVWAVVPEDSTP